MLLVFFTTKSVSTWTQIYHSIPYLSISPKTAKNNYIFNSGLVVDLGGIKHDVASNVNHLIIGLL
jgi:hypothetical protein